MSVDGSQLFRKGVGLSSLAIAKKMDAYVLMLLVLLLLVVPLFVSERMQMRKDAKRF